MPYRAIWRVGSIHPRVGGAFVGAHIARERARQIDNRTEDAADAASLKLILKHDVGSFVHIVMGGNA